MPVYRCGACRLSGTTTEPFPSRSALQRHLDEVHGHGKDKPAKLEPIDIGPDRAVPPVVGPGRPVGSGQTLIPCPNGCGRQIKAQGVGAHKRGCRGGATVGGRPVVARPSPVRTTARQRWQALVSATQDRIASPHSAIAADREESALEDFRAALFHVDWATREHRR